MYIIKIVIFYLKSQVENIKDCYVHISPHSPPALLSRQKTKINICSRRAILARGKNQWTRCILFKIVLIQTCLKISKRILFKINIVQKHSWLQNILKSFTKYQDFSFISLQYFMYSFVGPTHQICIWSSKVYFQFFEWLFLSIFNCIASPLVPDWLTHSLTKVNLRISRTELMSKVLLCFWHS